MLRITELEPREAILVKGGGTWDMRYTSRGLAGSGRWDDEEIRRLEDKLGWDPALPKHKLMRIERKIMRILSASFAATEPEPLQMQDQISEWCPNFRYYVFGEYFPIFSADSSHLRPAFTAPRTVYLLRKGREKPSRLLLTGEGTDNAADEVEPQYDAFAFDLSPNDLAVLNGVGANQAWMENPTDAPGNFEDLGKTSRAMGLVARTRSGAYWTFIKRLYSASSFVKIDPMETRTIEGQNTFLSPHGKVHYVDQLFDQWLNGGMDLGLRLTPEEDREITGLEAKRAAEGHIADRLTEESLFDALSSTHTVDLGDQTAIWEEVKKILDPHYKAVVIAAHSLGNSSNPIRKACVEATHRGKLVVVTSRSLIGETSTRYAGSLASINNDELRNSGEVVIVGHKLNKTVARAVTSRAILENLNPKATQELFDDYCRARGML